MSAATKQQGGRVTRPHRATGKPLGRPEEEAGRPKTRIIHVPVSEELYALMHRHAEMSGGKMARLLREAYLATLVAGDHPVAFTAAMVRDPFGHRSELTRPGDMAVEAVGPPLPMDDTIETGPRSKKR